ncbi:MAG: two-component regulator propeller domain-containing protein [Verrucomicrobiota bacterium]
MTTLLLKKVFTLAASFGLHALLLLGSGLRAESADAPRFLVDHWSTKEGLPQKAVITMLQSRDGYLWFGTLNGLVRFDGIRFVVFDESNTPGLKSSRIVKLFEDSRGNFWIGTETAGAAFAKNGAVKTLDLGQGRREGMLVSACEDSTGAVWLYTKDGELGRYRDGKVDVWNLPANQFNRCRAVIAEKSGLVWIGQDQLLFSVDPKKVKSSSPLQPEQVAPVTRLDFLLASGKGGQWRLADGSVQKWVDAKQESNWAYPWPANTRITSACEDREGNLVVGTLAEGIFWFDAAGQVTRLTEKEGLSYNSVLSLHADAEGSLWVGLDGEGLNRVKRQLFKVLEPSVGLTVQSICEDLLGGFWFSSNNKGVGYYKDGVVQQVNSKGGPMSIWNVRPLLLDRQQRLWAGTLHGGLFQLQNRQFEPTGNLRDTFALHEDLKGQIWAGTLDGLARLDADGIKKWRMKEGLSANIVRAIADDSAGNLWIGTEGGGLNRFRDGKFVSFRQASGFPSDNISCLHVDAEGVLWVGTFGSGLVRFKENKWTHYTVDQGLISNGIGYIIEDKQNCLWIGTYTGLMRIRKKALNDFAEKKIRFIPCRSFGERDGLPSSECTQGSQPAAYGAKDGHLWFPTTAGLASVDPMQFHFNTNPPPVLIESILVEGKKQNTNGLNARLPERIVLPPGKNRLEIQYSSLDLSAPNTARFKYRLAGYEEWSEVGTRRVASYPKLPPGKYRFEVTACNEDGFWNGVPSSLAIIVQPPFWRTWWFLTLAVWGTLAMIVGVVHFISVQKMQRQLEGFRQQQALEKERARIARDIHDQVGASLTQVSLLGEMVESDKNFPEEVEAHARQISQAARETSHALDEIVWTVNPSNDTLDGLITYICKHAQDYLSVAGLRYRLEIPASLPAKTISPEARHNVFLTAKEAVTNIVKHAHATEVWIRLAFESRNFILKIEDNGRGPGGANTEAARLRNGLSNMRKRMEDIGGKFSMTSRPEGGTIVALTVPIANATIPVPSPRGRGLG